MKKFTHRELCFDLAFSKGTTFVEVPLGSVWLNGNRIGKADVVTIKPSYNKFNLDIYEIKTSRSDLMHDIKSKKYEKYLQHSNRLYFATISGIAKKEDIPEGVGLIVRGEKGWKTVKPAKKRDISFSNETLLSLAFYRGRALKPNREYLGKLKTVKNRFIFREDLKGLGNEIKDIIMNYKKTKNLLYDLLEESMNKMCFNNLKERREFEEKWLNHIESL